MAIHQSWAFAFGLLGNIISFMVYLAPLPTFYQIYQKKSSGGFQSVPYVVALFSSMLWIYYAMVKKDANLLITINSIGCLIESIYIMLFIFYATKKTRIQTVKLLLLLDFFGFGLMALLTHFLAKGAKRILVLGWISLVFNLGVFAAPLCIMRQVMRTKSVEYMPFPLSFFLTLGAVAWFFYGLFLKDYYIALPNTVGFIFGIAQMALYLIYKDAKKVSEETKLHVPEHIVDLVKLSTIVCPEINTVVPLSKASDNEAIGDPAEKEKAQETKEDMNETIKA
ncbi:bidirectional sugar transporter SWEET10-like [Carya illinoinensis]|uniref:Bidirectional sugar transporter SWEET n=1 Tax=Carya illinoinensis TaxID=32201 RepID=A0A8T1NVD1_CARIL|nr:bidirectional sugar transporter SWEET10-like [Carya illinoinensis]KAG6632797.1 hypothetical protein CIPAW_12G003200 [Carya illinoinensis]KAG6683247.1 hypothetical protein I3842_12G002600 [Carya illinoinensis]